MPDRFILSFFPSTVFLCWADYMLPTFHVPSHLFTSYIRRGSARFRFGIALPSTDWDIMLTLVSSNLLLTRKRLRLPIRM